ncbi:MAG: hypothetical protein P4M11_03150 [Candidatus Pacebacteria bacterium]|nr:hypothetical protein [Candidatus Paceibacterota bacterium]
MTNRLVVIQIYNELEDLEEHFFEQKKRGRKMLSLYDSVQQADGLLQRLYLMITAGTVYIKTGEGVAKDVLRDLLEMARAVQQPLRGLFLRYFLLKKAKDLFPSEYPMLCDSMSIDLQPNWTCRSGLLFRTSSR